MAKPNRRSFSWVARRFGYKAECVETAAGCHEERHEAGQAEFQVIDGTRTGTRTFRAKAATTATISTTIDITMVVVITIIINPQTGLVNPWGYTTRFGPPTPLNNLHTAFWGVPITPGVFYMLYSICGGDWPEYLRGY